MNKNSATKTGGNTIEPFTVAELTKRYPLTADQARHLMVKHGNDRNMLNIAAAKMTGDAPNG